MKFEQHKLYKHDNNTDVAFEYLGTVGTYDDSISVIASWWNIVKSHPPYKMNVKLQVINIKNEQLPNWKLYDRR